MKGTLAALLVLAFTLPNLAEPGTAIARARNLLAKHDFAAALQLLREASPEAAAITGIKERTAALSAIHFYSAVALVEMGRENDASVELRTFFRYQPNSSLNPSQYSGSFTLLFNKTRRDVAHGIENYRSFDDAYPGSGFAYSRPPWKIGIWGASSEFQLLATETEKAGWLRLHAEDLQLRFVAGFWSARDPNPLTAENELRDQVLNRIAFADFAFADTIDGRGSLSDRGRVYVLLGKPARLSIRPLTSREAQFSPRRRMSATGAIEEWTYFRDQIPGKVPAHEVTFRFVNDTGGGHRVLQQDFLSTKALAAAKASLNQPPEP